MRREDTTCVALAALVLLALSGCRDATAPVEDPTEAPAAVTIDLVTGDLTVTNTTRGSSPDEDGYIVTVDGSRSGTMAPNASVTFGNLTVGPHRVVLSGVAQNCRVDGDNARIVLVLALLRTETEYAIECEAAPPPPPPPPPSGARVVGDGAIGDGPATPGGDRLEFSFDVTDAPGGRAAATDYSVVREDGSVGRMVVDSEADPETGVTSFTRTSETCVRFGGMTRLDTDELMRFFIDVCDNGDPGAGADTFTVDLPDRPFRRSGTLSEGDIVIGSR